MNNLDLEIEGRLEDDPLKYEYQWIDVVTGECHKVEKYNKNFYIDLYFKERIETNTVKTVFRSKKI